MECKIGAWQRVSLLSLSLLLLLSLARQKAKLVSGGEQVVAAPGRVSSGAK